MMNGMFGSVIPPAGGRSIHVQTKEQTLENDIHRHSKLAKKELKAAGKAERKAMKEHTRLEKAMRKGDMSNIEKHSIKEESLREEARMHNTKASQEESAIGNSSYELQAAKLVGNTGYARCKNGAPAVITSSNYNQYAAGWGRR